jgi:hypothetical protein
MVAVVEDCSWPWHGLDRLAPKRYALFKQNLSYHALLSDVHLAAADWKHILCDLSLL